MPSMWKKTKGSSKRGFDKAWHTLDKLGDPVNRLSNRVGAEAFWPMTIDKESDKAARILRSFCKDGFYSDDVSEHQSLDSEASKKPGKITKPKGKQRVIKKIPTSVIQRAKGLAIFTTMRTGLWLSGSGGSGVLLARIPETGEWSPPSGIMLHTAGIGFLAGVDIYDCVVVINTHEALEAFKKVRCTLGGEVSASAGPVGIGGVLESEVHKRQSPIWTYMKSRGLYAGVQVDGTIIIERTDENERFYGERISVTDILAGKAKNPPASIKTLIQTIKAAQGDSDIDERLVPPPGETPGDVDLQTTPGTFGIPDPEDPDPFGVKALEAEGLFIREAGTRARPSVEVFDFKPSPNSPVYATFQRSLDSSPRNSWRASVQSYASIDRGTQTDGAPATAPTSISRASSRSNRDYADRIEMSTWDSEENRWETIIPERRNETHVWEANEEENDDDDDEKELLDDDDVEIHEASSTTITKRESAANSPSPASLEDPTVPADLRGQSPTFTRARLVTIPKRVPPALPPRNPQRAPSSISTPTSPTSVPSSPDGRYSVTSTSGLAVVDELNELPFHPANDTSSVAFKDAEVHNPLTRTCPDKDEFHSLSSAVSSYSVSDRASDTEFSTKEASLSDFTPSKTENPSDSVESAEAPLETTKTITKNDAHTTTALHSHAV
ncbi:hypothetical protein EYZ11_004802 [Aspergillus tanneri]|uniref:Ysc84 actin-binding domain-containing protein n=1 Tax=Aspergillus tanneri TaxID=1220188 RepID=A0A4V3UPM3_9EURO|nr:uncharacterized protein ATNIH1004_006333 [Aspergillus tanneri]KAA8647639.1 hypothetical protein ATNIH1004_006333 [Aspergillus tanneri]THC95724.1 hypothetical protein EYZ11_004802 [Aspergillus tanneri]